MPTTTIYVERELPCDCLALSETPFAACPACDGGGLAWREIEVAVEYRYYKASRGSRDRYGVPMEPDEPEQVEIESTSPIELEGSEMERAEEACLEDVRDSYEAAMEARAEARAEARLFGDN